MLDTRGYLSQGEATQNAPAAVGHQLVVLSEAEACTLASLKMEPQDLPQEDQTSRLLLEVGLSILSLKILPAVETLFHVMLILWTWMAGLSRGSGFPAVSLFMLPYIFKQDYLNPETWYLQLSL